MQYFSQKEQNIARAKSHTDDMTRRFSREIEFSVLNSEILGSSDPNKFIPICNFPVTDLRNVSVVASRTEDAIAREDQIWVKDSNISPAIRNKYGTRIAVLNFASFKNPGGAFLGGSSAQEESLCHVSFLYNVLSQFKDTYYAENMQMLNRALYVNRGIYSPKVFFTYDNGQGLECAQVDVFTIAAPNAGTARKIGVDQQEIRKELRKRIRFVIQSMLDHGPYLSVILGAFGCGVFQNDPKEVATGFYKELDNSECRDRFYRVIFAIYGDNNIEPFQRLLNTRRTSFGKKF